MFRYFLGVVYFMPVEHSWKVADDNWQHLLFHIADITSFCQQKSTTSSHYDQGSLCKLWQYWLDPSRRHQTILDKVFFDLPAQAMSMLVPCLNDTTNHQTTRPWTSGQGAGNQRKAMRCSLAHLTLQDETALPHFNIGKENHEKLWK